MEETLPADILHDIMDKASPWTAYSMGLTCKSLLFYYQSGRCSHNLSPDMGESDRISSIFDKPQKASVKKYCECKPNWSTYEDTAGRSKPQGSLFMGNMRLSKIDGIEFAFVANGNLGGARTERRLLLIDDYYKLKKGKKYKSFVKDDTGCLTKFQVYNCQPDKHQPQRHKGLIDIDMFCKTKKQVSASYRGGFLNGKKSRDCDYDSVGIEIKPVETPKTFRVCLEIVDESMTEEDYFVSDTSNEINYECLSMFICFCMNLFCT